MQCLCPLFNLHTRRRIHYSQYITVNFLHEACNVTNSFHHISRYHHPAVSCLQTHTAIYLSWTQEIVSLCSRKTQTPTTTKIRPSSIITSGYSKTSRSASRKRTRRNTFARRLRRKQEKGCSDWPNLLIQVTWACTIHLNETRPRGDADIPRFML